MRNIFAFILIGNIREDNDEKHHNADLKLNRPLPAWDGHSYSPVVGLDEARDRKTAVACAQRSVLASTCVPATRSKPARRHTRATNTIRNQGVIVRARAGHGRSFRPRNSHIAATTTRTAKQMQAPVYQQTANTGAPKARSLTTPSAKPAVLRLAQRLMYRGSHLRWRWLCSQAARSSIGPPARVMSRNSHWKKK
jgi:hypothetical protein